MSSHLPKTMEKIGKRISRTEWTALSKDQRKQHYGCNRSPPMQMRLAEYRALPPAEKKAYAISRPGHEPRRPVSARVAPDVVRLMAAMGHTNASLQSDRDELMLAADEILARIHLPPRYLKQRVIRRDGKGRVKPPTVIYTPEAIKAIFLGMAEGLSRYAAMALQGVDYNSMKRWEEAMPQVHDLIELGRGLRVARMERELLDTTIPTVATTRLKALANANPEDWSDTQRVEINSTHTFIAAIQEAQKLSLPAPRPPMVDITPRSTEHIPPRQAPGAGGEALYTDDLTSEMEKVFG